jgi:sugar lactone lactonase YvrE
MKPNVVATGLRLGEGPTWRSATKDLICVSIADGVLYQIDPAAGTRVSFADTAGSPNGTAPCVDGGVLVAQNGGIDFRVVRFPNPQLQERLEQVKPPGLADIRYTAPGIQRVSPDGSVAEIIGSDFGFSAPNDLVVAPDNSVIFTDTGVTWRNGAPEPAGTAGIYRYRPEGVEAWPSNPRTVGPSERVELLAATRANGVAVSPEGRILAVAEGGLRWIEPDGALAPFYDDAQVDGLTFDLEGRVYACVPWSGTILVLSATGKLLEELQPPEGGMHPTNCCFGGESMDTLFVTDFLGSRVLAWSKLHAPGFAAPAFRD